MNEHYFGDYRSKFFTYYKGTRLKAKSSFMRNLEDDEDKDITKAINDALSSLAKLGLQGLNAPALANLLPLDPMEPAIGIMADVRAYFQGS
jgi:Dynamin GTPase effector domain